MTQYNSINVKLSSLLLDKLKSAIKNKTEVVLTLSSKMVGDDETNFLHKLLLTNRQVSNLRKAFANHSSADIRLSKTQLSKMIQSRRFLGKLLDYFDKSLNVLSILSGIISVASFAIAIGAPA